jgi:HEPN domain-containing protein
VIYCSQASKRNEARRKKLDEFVGISGRYLYVVFLCHLAIEKMLKALVAEVYDKPAPRSHDLIFLIRRIKMVPKPRLYEFVSKLNNASVMTRYPSDMQAALRDYTRDIAASYLEQTEEVLEWLRSDPRLRE